MTRMSATLMLRHILHHLVGLSNAAILIVGYLGAFPDLPSAHWHHAAGRGSRRLRPAPKLSRPSTDVLL